jgi:hypothetical protein
LIQIQPQHLSHTLQKTRWTSSFPRTVRLLNVVQ